MAKKTGKREEVRSFSFRMPVHLYDDLAAVARAHGVDVSAMLNWVLSEYRPTLVKKRAEYEKAMMDAAASREWEKMGSPAEALRVLHELLGKLQDEYTQLSRRVLESDARRAG